MHEDLSVSEDGDCQYDLYHFSLYCVPSDQPFWYGMSPERQIT